MSMPIDASDLAEDLASIAVNLERAVAATADAATRRGLTRDERRVLYAALPRYMRAIAILIETLSRAARTENPSPYPGPDLENTEKGVPRAPRTAV
jgi:hypothetical protein